MDHVQHVPIDTIPIDTDVIRLGQFLKLAGIVESGAQVKSLLADGLVAVNNEVEHRRGRQLVPGDQVALGDHIVQVGGPVRSGSDEVGGRDDERT